MPALFIMVNMSSLVAQAMQALQASGGNVEAAAAMLTFGSDAMFD